MDVFNKKSGLYAPASSGGVIPSTLSLLMHMDGVDGGTVFTDDGFYGHTFSVNNPVVTTETTDPKFGTAAAALNASGNLIGPDDTTFDFGTGEFSIDYWGRNIDAGLAIAVSKGAGTNQWAIYSSGTTLNAFIRGVNTLAGTIPLDDSWYHVEMSRTAGVLYLYVNGVGNNLVETGVITGVASGLRIGTDLAGNAPLDGIDELRIQKGVGGHTSDFTPPTGPYDGTE
jgi:hypothetical protein